VRVPIRPHTHTHTPRGEGGGALGHLVALQHAVAIDVVAVERRARLTRGEGVQLQPAEQPRAHGRVRAGAPPRRGPRPVQPPPPPAPVVALAAHMRAFAAVTTARVARRAGGGGCREWPRVLRGVGAKNPLVKL
jgi:hypothetical protein